MANIHGLNDPLNNRNNPQAPPPNIDPESQLAMKMFKTFGSVGDQEPGSKAPRDYNFWDFWSSTFCPNFSVFAFPFVIWVINTILYFATLIGAGVKHYPLDDRIFLGIQPEFLNNLQATNPWEIRYNNQLWRPFVSLFLTGSFEQYTICSFFLLLIGFMTQNTKVKFVTQLAFYLITGFAGIMFGAAVNPIASLTVGCMPAIFGMLGGQIACIVVNLKALEAFGKTRFILIVVHMLLFLVMILYVLGGKSNNIARFHIVDAGSDCMSFLVGMMLGLVMMPKARRAASYVGSYEKLCMKIGAGLTLIYFVILFSCFYTSVAYPKNCFADVNNYC